MKGSEKSVKHLIRHSRFKIKRSDRKKATNDICTQCGNVHEDGCMNNGKIFNTKIFNTKMCDRKIFITKITFKSATITNPVIKSLKVITAMSMCFMFLTLSACGNVRDGLTITNVSYDPTREFYESYNELFKKYYADKTGQQVNIIQSHGGSGSQARSVVEGCNADVVTLALEHDISLIQNTGLINDGWIEEFDKDSSPYTSTIVFLVRKGNEKNIKDWDDLVKDDVEVITPDPKSSGGACWNFLAALSYAQNKYSDISLQKDFLKKLYGNVSVLDSGARGSTTTFVENGKGDVLIAWENEAIATVKNYPDKYEIISPSVSILAQPSVAIVDDNVSLNKTEQLSHDYLEYLYSDDAQRLAADNGYRPSDENILKEYRNVFNLNMKLTNINVFGGWNGAYKTYFDDGALFDEIYN